MSKRIAVPLPDDIVDFIDGLVARGQATSRAVVVERALDRERLRVSAARDATATPVEASRGLGSRADGAMHTRLDSLD